ncbi:MAG: hypothetical protein BV459_06700 [Thermoplasmata archaeon M11B2D]|nr:MAG: hypothetical protein BV459_06700 [Thermoplasmata archaeon M11B2D]
MRVWDIHPSLLCDKHLLGLHREIHSIFTVVAEQRDGYSRHPEVKRWFGKLASLYDRHSSVVEEMERRVFNHRSPIDKTKAIGHIVQSDFVTYEKFHISKFDGVEQTPSVQKQILTLKNCECRV